MISQDEAHLSPALPYLGVSPRQDFRVKVGIPLAWDSLDVRLSPNFDLRQSAYDTTNLPLLP